MNVLKIRNGPNSPWTDIAAIIGKEGFSPTIEVKEETGSSYVLTITNQDGSFDTPNLKGTGSGGSGENGATFYPSVSSDGLLSWTNDKGLENPTSVNIKGPQGNIGPQGPTGADGKAGKDGINGVSPIIEVTDTDTGVTLTIHDVNGVKTAYINDGEQGPQGPQGPKGETGANGYTPVKGTDYWTEEDKTEIVNSVLAALPNGNEVSY